MAPLGVMGPIGRLARCSTHGNDRKAECSFLSKALYKFRKARCRFSFLRQKRNGNLTFSLDHPYSDPAIIRSFDFWIPIWFEAPWVFGHWIWIVCAWSIRRDVALRICGFARRSLDYACVCSCVAMPMHWCSIIGAGLIASSDPQLCLFRSSFSFGQHNEMVLCRDHWAIWYPRLFIDIDWSSFLQCECARTRPSTWCALLWACPRPTGTLGSMLLASVGQV